MIYKLSLNISLKDALALYDNLVKELLNIYSLRVEQDMKVYIPSVPEEEEIFVDSYNSGLCRAKQLIRIQTHSQDTSTRKHQSELDLTLVSLEGSKRHVAYGNIVGLSDLQAEDLIVTPYDIESEAISIKSNIDANRKKIAKDQKARLFFPAAIKLKALDLANRDDHELIPYIPEILVPSNVISGALLDECTSQVLNYLFAQSDFEHFYMTATDMKFMTWQYDTYKFLALFMSPKLLPKILTSDDIKKEFTVTITLEPVSVGSRTVQQTRYKFKPLFED